MFLKLFLLIITSLVINIIAATDAQHDKNLGTANDWKNGRKSTSLSASKPNWLDQIEKYYVDIVVAFNTFPVQLSGQVDFVTTEFRKFLVKVIALSNSKSSTVSTGATATLEALKEVNIDERTAQGVINEFLRVLPTLMKAYRGIVTNLKTTIGDELVYSVNSALRNTEQAFKRYMEKFNAGDGSGLKREIDYEPVMRSVQQLTNAILLMRKGKLSKRQLVLPEVQDALVVLNLFLDHIAICNHGLSSCSASVLLQQDFKNPLEVMVL